MFSILFDGFQQFLEVYLQPAVLLMPKSRLEESYSAEGDRERNGNKYRSINTFEDKNGRDNSWLTRPREKT